MLQEKVTIYLPDVATLPAGFQNMVDSLGAFIATEVVRSFGCLRTEFVPQTKGLRPIVVAVAPTRADLERLVESRHLLEDTRLVLLLPDADEETVSLGHLVRPRFIADIHNGPGEIAEVVQKMVGWSKR